MHLLNVEGVDLDIVKVERFRPPYPPYLVLSHTWSQDPDEEVSFHDVHDGKLRYLEKRAWRKKVRGFCKVAKNAGYSYVWIDTCCIDQANDTEFTEAINSMHAWYQSATACFVHLGDITRDRGDMMIFEHAERFKSKRPRWSTRGWTLQELVTPEKLYFFDRHWHRLGSHSQLGGAVRPFYRHLEMLHDKNHHE